jgi:hypothetical protein
VKDLYKMDVETVKPDGADTTYDSHFIAYGNLS